MLLLCWAHHYRGSLILGKQLMQQLEHIQNVYLTPSAEHSTVYVKLVTGTVIAWSLSHVGLYLTESRSNGWTTQRQ
ncbi:unnamed protein product [Cuscuta campestris]|uniref:Uncharacterized protein n=1 Tax=Cuscuta campestris TaxID=132261 RepID=A0A484MNB2_9ASTE|nr:unnamed protein product [Cuscuta campestris]